MSIESAVMSLLSFLILVVYIGLFFVFFLAWLESLTLLYFFKEPTLLSLIFFYWFPDLIFIISFLLSTLDFIVLLFLVFYGGDIRLYLDLSSFLIYACNAIKFTLTTICVESPPNFDKLYFFHLVQNTIKFLETSSLTHLLFRSMLFNTHISGFPSYLPTTDF